MANSLRRAPSTRGFVTPAPRNVKAQKSGAELKREMGRLIITGNRDEAQKLVAEALEAGLTERDIIALRLTVPADQKMAG